MCVHACMLCASVRACMHVCVCVCVSGKNLICGHQISGKAILTMNGCGFAKALPTGIYLAIKS